MKKTVFFLLAVVCFALVGVSSALAGSNSFGVRAGYGSEPDQFVIGGRALMGNFLKITRFAPGFDYGTGDNITTYTFNGDVLLLLKLPNSSLALYAAGGPTVTYWDADKGGSDTEVGATIAGGLRLPMGKAGFYELEARFGIGDVPEFKLMFGIMFGGK
ncbi:MAG: hypothetical protein JXA92_02265 [candidate division Zixibacteria bacterium]|nr:hypothetical protein [candidate division Zixibacteria bacterium]